MKVQDFYNKISEDYPALLRKAVPRYDEMLDAILEYIPPEFKPKRVLELGCGSGNLTDKVISRFPGSLIEVVDISGDFLHFCKIRFKERTKIIYHQMDFKDLDFDDSSFDLVVSSISIHHIEDHEKLRLFEIIYNILKPNGKLIFADQTKGSNEYIYKKHIEAWHKEAIKLGSSEEDWKMWMDHQNKHDFHSTVMEHFDWMKNANFKNIDILWKNLLWTVFYGEK
ncbi:MAG TPA: methyltransferase domain-containing protein [Bacteroidetes bacterium]|nr:methyltransferase domain-containing protein [Bacteroidota bacterium]